MAANRKYSTPAGIANPGDKKRPKVGKGRTIMAGKNAAHLERGVDANRRRFLGGTALAALGAIIGDALPFSGTSGIRSANAQGTPPAAAPATPAPPPRRRDRNI
jgi:hypothetical protein